VLSNQLRTSANLRATGAKPSSTRADRSVRFFRRSVRSSRIALQLDVVACRKLRISPRICCTSRSAPPASTRAAAGFCSLCWARSGQLADSHVPRGQTSLEVGGEP
jgi:hypothetical protein